MQQVNITMEELENLISLLEDGATGAALELVYGVERKAHEAGLVPTHMEKAESLQWTRQAFNGGAETQPKRDCKSYSVDRRGDGAYTVTEFDDRGRVGRQDVKGTLEAGKQQAALWNATRAVKC